MEIAPLARVRTSRSERQNRSRSAFEVGLFRVLALPFGSAPKADHVATQSAPRPFDIELELAVIDGDGPHALVFPCRRALRGWIKAETGGQIAVRPTHWRPWNQTQAARLALPG